MKKYFAHRPFLKLAALAAAGVFASSVSAVAFGEEVLEPGLTWDCGFSPGGTSLDRVLRGIADGAHPHGSILVAAYEFTSKPIADALLEAKESGATVAIVADTTENQKEFSKVHYLAAQGIPVKFDNRLKMLHSKFMVIDEHAVETGSFNYTGAAASDEHSENACVFRHAPRMAHEFMSKWADLWRESDPIQ